MTVNKRMRLRDGARNDVYLEEISVKKALSVFMILILCAALLCSCGKKTTGSDGEVRVVLSGGVELGEIATVRLSEANLTTQDSAADLLRYLDNRGTMANVVSGGWLQSIGSLMPVGNSYLALFVNNIQWADVSAYALAPIEYGGETLYYCGYGLSDITLFDGLTLMVVLTTY
jgi:hypothetical protein